MRDRYIIMPANIKPSRSRNSSVDLAKFRDAESGAGRLDGDATLMP